MLVGRKTVEKTKCFCFLYQGSVRSQTFRDRRNDIDGKKKVKNETEKNVTVKTLPVNLFLQF